MTTDSDEEFEAGIVIGRMWRRLGEQISDAIPDILINRDDPVKAVKWATCAEACFWKATGDADAHDVKDILPVEKAVPENGA